MSKRVNRVPVTLDTKGVNRLSQPEIAAILRGADDLIMTGGRNMLAKILKGSRDQKILELKLDESPVYGYYRHLTLEEITARIDRVILDGYLDIEYDYRLPLLVFTEKGWEIERDTYASELLQGFDRLLESGSSDWDMSYLKDRNRGLILLLLDKVEQSGKRKYIPLLETWAQIDYKKVRQRIHEVIAALSSQPEPASQIPPEPEFRDDIARLNRANFARDKREGRVYTIPWLNLDVEAFRRVREGKTSVLPQPHCDDPVDRVMMAGVKGQRVLCLAGGGGQQSAVFSLLGAEVTVLDLTPEQLEGDAQAAEHYGYTVTLIQGDMRDLSRLPEDYFDRVYQPISTLYVPDLRGVYAAVQRVLSPGGLYFADYCYPFTMVAENRGWDGEGYTLYVREPYQRGATLETPDGIVSFTRGEPNGEFHHLLADIFNGLIEHGLQIQYVWDNPRPDARPPLEQLQPDSNEHRDRFIPFGISVISRKA